MTIDRSTSPIGTLSLKIRLNSPKASPKLMNKLLKKRRNARASVTLSMSRRMIDAWKVAEGLDREYAKLSMSQRLDLPLRSAREEDETVDDNSSPDRWWITATDAQKKAKLDRELDTMVHARRAYLIAAGKAP